LCRTVAQVAAQPASATAVAGGANMKRLMKEINLLNSNPLSNVYFFPSESDPLFWKIIMIGPTGSPYDGYTFVLSMQFPNDYPFKPPKVRFITPIYHCNVSKTGTICHSVLSHNYSPAITAKEIMIHISNLLIEPNIDDQIENSVAQDYYVDRALYYKKLEENCKKDANLSLKKRLEEMGLLIESVSLHHPQDYIDPITKQLMIDPVTSTVSSYTYERSYIVEQIRKNGIDPVNNKPLAESQLTPNETLKKTISKYMTSIYGQTI